MSLEYISYYRENPSYKIQTNTLTWPKTSVKLVTVDANSITIEYEDHSITLNIWGGDTRDKLDMDFTPCNRPSEGCCFEHSTCGYDKCSTHNPLQEITFECDTKQLLNNKIVDFVLTGWDDFLFILDNDEGSEITKEVPLSVTNSLPGSSMTIYITDDS